MSDEKPRIVDLRKEDSEEDEEDPSRNPENEMDTESEGDVYEESRDEYPDGVEDNDEAGDADENRKDPSGSARGSYSDETEEELTDETGVEMPDAADADGVDDGEPASKSEDEKAFSLRDFNLTTKFADEKGFNDLKEGSVVLIDTPLEGGKVGEVTSKEESWSGTLYVKVDTGGNKYEISPYEDEFSERFIACIDEQGEVTPDILERLGKTTIDKVEVGNQVMIDVPKVGPVRGTVSHKAKTETQGAKVDVNCGATSFTIYEEPSPTQRKESPILIGRIQ